MISLRPITSNRAAIAIMTALLLPVLIGMTALVVDVGFWYGSFVGQKGQVIAAANAATRSELVYGNWLSQGAYLKIANNAASIASPSISLVNDFSFSGDGDSILTAKAVEPSFFSRIIGFNGFTEEFSYDVGIQLGAPNPGLAAFQQAEIVNATAEIETGTASVACLEAMNGDVNAAKMSANSATCLGPGYGIVPPPSPVMEVGTGEDGVLFQITENGAIYSYSGWDAEGTGGANGGAEGSAQYYMGNSNIAFYNNGYIDANGFDWNYGVSNGGDANCDGGHADGNYSGGILTPQANTYGGVVCTSPSAQLVIGQAGVVDIGPGNMGYYVGNGSTIVTW